MSSNKTRYLLLVAALAVTALPATPSTADGVLYDNANLGNDTGFGVLGPRPDSNADRLAAQQFFTNNDAVVTSASVVIQRLGSPSGTLHLDIWNDTNGTPGSQVARLGSFDISEIARRETSILADGLAVSLDPNTPYHLVLDNIDLNIPNRDNSYRLGVRTSDEGTFGAGRYLVTSPSDDDDWLVLGNMIPGANYVRSTITAVSEPSSLQAGDADQDLDFDQIDLVQVQVASKYLTGESATWGEGDWNGAPGGLVGDPPLGDSRFDQLDIVAALGAGVYLTGPYAAIRSNGQAIDGQTSIVYDANTGEVAVDAPRGTELTSISIDSKTGIFTAEAAQNLGGSFDNDGNNNVFKATFGNSFGSLSFGNVAQSGLSEQFLMGDLSIVGSLAGGGDLGEVDLVYVPEPSTIGMLVFGTFFGVRRFRRLD